MFYGGKPPKGIKTNWIMHEYRLVDNTSTSKPTTTASDATNKKGSLRVRKKKKKTLTIFFQSCIYMLSLM